MADPMPEPVSFIIVDEVDDGLVLTFALDTDDDDDTASLILMRNLRDVRMLPPGECGVSVSHELSLDPADAPDLLRRISITRTRARIETTRQRYYLSVTRVDRDELREAGALLRRMNFDHRFDLDLTEF